MINLCVGGRERPGPVCVRMLRIGGRAMMYKMYTAFIMSLSVAFTFASNQAFGQSGAAHGTRSPHHHNGRNIGTFFPAAGGFFWDFWGPSNGGLNVDVYRPTSDDIHFTCIYDVPWDWVHRCPPVVSPPELPPPPVVRAPGCIPQAVTVGMSDGKDQTVTIVRC